MQVNKRKNRSLEVVLGILLFLILCCFGYIAWLLYHYYMADLEYSVLREDYTYSDDADDNNDTGGDASRFPDKDIDTEGLLAANPDFVCWLYYPEGKIDLPVVKEREDDINGYLHRTFEGKRNSAGCVFMPYDASSDFRDLNTFLYGHNMANGSMFGSLKYLKRNPEENFKDPYFYIWTKDRQRMLYRVVAMYVVDYRSEMYSVPVTLEGYQSYLQQALSLGSVEGLVPFNDEETAAMGHGKPLVTLSVCFGRAGTSNRLLIQGVELVREDF